MKTTVKTRNTQEQDPAHAKRQVRGQHRRPKDSPDMDEHHDENRRNMYDPEVGEALKGRNKKD